MSGLTLFIICYLVYFLSGLILMLKLVYDTDECTLKDLFMILMFASTLGPIVPVSIFVSEFQPSQIVIWRRKP